MYNYKTIDDSTICISISKDAYNISAIKKCCSNFMHISFIKVEEDEFNYLVYFRLNEKSDDNMTQDIVNSFYNELLAESIRYDVSKETKNLREMIIGRALYATCIQDVEDSEATNGVRPDSNDNEFNDIINEEYNIDDIAVNWFKKDNE